jgi:hypothetical protein
MARWRLGQRAEARRLYATASRALAKKGLFVEDRRPLAEAATLLGEPDPLKKPRSLPPPGRREATAWPDGEIADAQDEFRPAAMARNCLPRKVLDKRLRAA